jgi:DNA modification methylase
MTPALVQSLPLVRSTSGPGAFSPVVIGDATLYLGDCREIIPIVGKVDAVITDPPYGCKATSGWGGKYSGFEIQGDDSTELRDFVIAQCNCPFAMFGSPRIDRPKNCSILIWSKGEHTGMGNLQFPWKPDFEEVYISGDGWSGRRTSSVLKFNARTDSERFHPTEKPIGLMVEIASKAPPGVILDPFMGSGTTGIACLKTGRKFIGIERDPEYFRIACERIRKEYSQITLL